MTVGHATTGYTEYYSRLTNQVVSFQKFNADIWPAFETANQGSYDWTQNNLASGDAVAIAFTNLMMTNFGLKYSDLNAYQKEKLEDAFDKSMAETNNNVIAENDYLYGSANGSGGYEPIGVTITHLLNERASIGWTSYSHTGVPVPVFAVGFDAYRFEGFYDNTDIAKALAKAIRYPGTLPVLKP